MTATATAAQTVTVTLRVDSDRRWASGWPPALVAAGGSPGVGRFDTRRDLVAAIQAAGWTLVEWQGPRAIVVRRDPQEESTWPTI